MKSRHLSWRNRNRSTGRGIKTNQVIERARENGYLVCFAQSLCISPSYVQQETNHGAESIPPCLMYPALYVGSDGVHLQEDKLLLYQQLLLVIRDEKKISHILTFSCDSDVRILLDLLQYVG
ncbi:hypothetical protein P691DRAFT_506572 [Macrolepiota fuliginosa MF-IS2]|uniref:Uncharacterized protein n=1 Tax=Macrolepiota fuliginosa MF-IS2 TaxID=1400762 RepID=A0A9P6BVS6_9AGAR|nr:hypothetical protein P691DRAFT_506572 [Macrolepiota fuliginosa MF-IS2]